MTVFCAYRCNKYHLHKQTRTSRQLETACTSEVSKLIYQRPTSMRKVEEEQNCAQLPPSEAMNPAKDKVKHLIPSLPPHPSHVLSWPQRTHVADVQRQRCMEGSIFMLKLLCKITYLDVRVNYFTGTFLMCWRTKHSHTNMFNKFHKTGRRDLGQPGHRRSSGRYLRSLVLWSFIHTDPVCHPLEFRLHGSHGTQTAATMQAWFPSRFLSSLFLTLTCLFVGF